jgi:hypothetical protein
MQDTSTSTARCSRCRKFWPIDDVSRLYVYPDDTDRHDLVGCFCLKCGDIVHADLMFREPVDTIMWRAY